MPESIENEYNFRRALSDGCNLFIGSGFSTLAKDQSGNSLPTGGALSVELGRAFEVENFSLFSLSQLSTIISHDRRSELEAYLRSRFTVGEFDRRYFEIDRINVSTIFTTNIDDLLFRVYSESSRSYLSDMDVQGATFNDRGAIDYVALHGCVRHRHRGFRFGSLEVASAYAVEPDRWQYLRQRLERYPTIFWGYGLSDAGTLQALTPDPTRSRAQADRWIVLRSPSAQDVTYFAALGFQIVVADTESMLEYLSTVPVAPESEFKAGPNVLTSDLFPDEAVPDPGTVAVRPILEFYLGSAPQWADIFSGQIHRTTHFNQIRNAVNSRKNVIVVGIPACGKTTLLMQVAASETGAGRRHRLFTDSLSLERARLINTRLNGSEAIVYVDNFANSVDGCDFLSKLPNVQLVVADRDYNFEIISHRIDLWQFDKPLDVTEVSAGDLQQCLSRVPEHVTLPATNRRSRRRPISLFEAIESRLRSPTLKARFGHVLGELAKEDVRLSSLLIMMSYVYKCRTPVSMDMVYGFTRGQVSGYEEIYALIRRLGQLVSQHTGTSIIPADFEDQDYYVPRSTIVGEAVMARAQPDALRDVILRFHRNVSPYRICQYDTFKRSAFDNDLMVRAFPDPDEGLSFYEEVYPIDGSPYVLQQAALYASKKRRFQDAFDLIDQALTESGNRVWSIRNSWAVILFNANIAHFDDPDGTGRRTLMDSMEILRECYESDRRKPYHAAMFAEHALRLWEDHQADEAKEYLRTADQWLWNEKQRSSWNWQVNELLPKVRSAVSSFP